MIGKFAKLYKLFLAKDMAGALAVQNEISGEENRRFLGQTVEILVEGPSKREARSVAQEETLYAECETLDAPEDAPRGDGLTSVDALVATGRSNDAQLTGRTACDRIVVFNGPTSLTGTFQRVRVVETSPFTLFGELVE